MSPISSRGPMPPDVLQRWEQALASIDPESILIDLAKATAAAKETTFSGFLRRCLHRAGRPISSLGVEADISTERLAAFLHGEGVLESDEIDRLLSHLDVEVMGSVGAH